MATTAGDSRTKTDAGTIPGNPVGNGAGGGAGVGAGIEAASGAQVEGGADPSESPPPSPAEDLQRLESCNWLAAARIQLERGRHPDPEIDALLHRVFGFPPDRFAGPYVIRVLVSLSMTFCICAVFWLIVWNLAGLMGWSELARVASTWSATVMVFLFGVVLSQPGKLIDEQALEAAGREAIAKLRADLAATAAAEKVSATAPEPESAANPVSAAAETVPPASAVAPATAAPSTPSSP